MVRSAVFATLPLAHAAVLYALFASAVSAQTPAWEAMPGVRELPTDPDPVVAIGWLRGEGAQADDPTADTLVVFGAYGAFLYNPSGAAGAAGSNGVWGPWHRLCAISSCTSPQDGIVTSAGSIIIGSGAGATGLARGANRGRTWTLNIGDIGAFPFFEASRAGADPRRVLIAGSSDDGGTVRSFSDGALGTWTYVPASIGFPQVFGEVPASGALPGGRVLYGTWSGVAYSDDGGLTYTASPGYGGGRYIAYSFAFAPVEGHPYGGAVYAGLRNLSLSPNPSAEVHRSDDGGQTWALAHRFTAEETGQPPVNGANISQAVLQVTADGALWAGVGLNNGQSPRRGGIMRSTDGGTTWARADVGFDGGDGRGYRVDQFRVGRDGRLYAATTRGVWRTTGPAVAGEAGPGAPSEVSVSVRPNPSSGRIEVVVTLAEAGSVRVSVLDVLGREVAVVLDGAASAGERTVGVDTSRWPAGVYVVRAEASGRVGTARLVVAH